MKTKQVITLLVIFLSAIVPNSNLSATGWNDYELNIGDGYKVIRSNALDISRHFPPDSGSKYPDFPPRKRSIHLIR